MNNLENAQGITQTDTTRHLSRTLHALRRDLDRAHGLFGAQKTFRGLLACLWEPGFHAVVNYRVCHWIVQQNRLIRIFLKPIKHFLSRRIRRKWGIEIQHGARVEEGFLINHFGGIFISSQAVIGKNFTIAQDVTIGFGGEGRRRGVPIVGNDVSIAPGAKLYGKIRIGNNVKVGPNAVVYRDLPDNAVVQTPPMQIVVMGTSRAEENLQ
jgi:serine O-acetyltransferase